MDNFFPVIEKFLNQASEGNSFNIKSYPKQFNDLQVKVSLGKGPYNQIPCIAFLAEGETTNRGIYPGLLYFNNLNLLILSYISSEDTMSNLRWELPNNIQTIRAYFQLNGLGIPARYAESFVYKVYSPISEIEPEIINKDLDDILYEYKKMMSRSVNEKAIEIQITEPFILDKTRDIQSTGLIFGKNLLYRYAVSLLTKPFVILSGLSGSGKTQLALTFAKWLSKDESQVKIISVGADWNNREYLLGYPNALEYGKYIKPENGVLDFIMEANANPIKPYFLILDEMNLSYVERYFADFLSAMESHEDIPLHPDTNEWTGCDVPASIKLPPNLYITGTINVDETTYMFSPKVLDRANVIEFRITENEMKEYLTHCTPLNPDNIKYKGANMGRDFIMISQDKEFENSKQINETLLSFFIHLKSAGAEFGYRTASEIYRFISVTRKLHTGWSDNELIDIAVMQRMLPKLHGSRKKMQPVLTALWDLCIASTGLIMIENEDISIDHRFRYPISAEKIRRMYINARDNGFTSYAEA
ncbi:DUF3578 domain-containing protein [Bacteroides sp. 519]|uniref:DUF3578 domain-containing protein n=1 Tax=Bacteroides sp. 519 TaxID=2302937 RepID=UPI0013D87669|nr:DUF3578 domain-containing protein [Bacteroides sp. 519]NDV59825.1 DUF3578 domain-containing protein [Bacteroides sp. 519]